MIAVSVDPIWPRRRWLTCIMSVLALQVTLIFVLAERKSAVQPIIPREVSVYMPARFQSEWSGPSSPALFILANPRGFSGHAWMQIPPLPYELPKWTDPSPPTITNSVAQLGSTLGAFLKTNLAAMFEFTPKPEPTPDIFLAFGNPVVAQSALTIEGELARRPLLTKFNLESWPANDILTNSVVLVGVDQSGNVFSAVLLADGKSGSKDADASALRQVNAARFKPLRPSNTSQANETRLQWGRFIFHWNTIAAAVTNSNPPSNASPSAPIIHAPRE